MSLKEAKNEPNVLCGKFASQAGEVLQSPQISPLGITAGPTETQHRESASRSWRSPGFMEVSPVMGLEDFSSMVVSMCHCRRM